LFLDFYKGGSRLYLQYWGDDELFIDDDFSSSSALPNPGGVPLVGKK